MPTPIAVGVGVGSRVGARASRPQPRDRLPDDACSPREHHRPPASATTKAGQNNAPGHHFATMSDGDELRHTVRSIAPVGRAYNSVIGDVVRFAAESPDLNGDGVVDRVDLWCLADGMSRRLGSTPG